MNKLLLIKRILRNQNLSKKEKASFLIDLSCIDQDGRRRLCVKGKIRLLSRVIWNLYYPNDKVKSGELIHHKNNNVSDDQIGNYEKLPNNSIHAKLHYDEMAKKHGGRHPLHSPEIREKAASQLRGRPCSEETKCKIGDSNRGKTRSAETIANMSKAHLGQKPTVECLAKRSISLRKTAALKLKWSPTGALRLRKMGLSKREIGRRLGICPSGIACYFKLRGVSY